VGVTFGASAKPDGFPPAVIAGEASAVGGMRVFGRAAVGAPFVVERPVAHPFASVSPMCARCTPFGPPLSAMATPTQAMSFVRHLIGATFDASVEVFGPASDLEVMAVVVPSPEQDQVLQTVVVSDVVDVMDIAPLRDGSVGVFPDFPVFVDIAPPSGISATNLDIPVGGHPPSASPTAIAFARRSCQRATTFADLRVMVGVPFRTLDAGDGLPAATTGLGSESCWHANSIAGMER
jgi:hypothetical protein